MIITIDGPSISGKTSIARMLAQHLGYDYLASGLLFRGLAYILVHQFNYHESQLYHPQLVDVQAALSPSNFNYMYCCQKGERLLWKEKDITAVLSDPLIGKYASIIGTNQDVRIELAQLQHTLAEGKNVVTDGRDAGSVIFPHALIKFFLTASSEVRANRWQKNQKLIGREIPYEQALNEINERDERDANRRVAPLRIADGAIVIDSSDLSQEQVLATLLHEIQKKGGR